MPLCPLYLESCQLFQTTMLKATEGRNTQSKFKICFKRALKLVKKIAMYASASTDIDYPVLQAPTIRRRSERNKQAPIAKWAIQTQNLWTHRHLGLNQESPKSQAYSTDSKIFTKESPKAPNLTTQNPKTSDHGRWRKTSPPPKRPRTFHVEPTDH